MSVKRIVPFKLKEAAIAPGTAEIEDMYNSRLNPFFAQSDRPARLTQIGAVFCGNFYLAMSSQPDREGARLTLLTHS